MITNFIQLDFNKENDLKVPSVQYDSGSRFVKIKLQRNKSPFEIDGYRVTVVANKVDGTEIMNDCTILDGVNGVVQFEITEQFNAVEGVVDCQLKLFKGKTLLTSMPFSINVVKSVSTKEIVSSNELKTLVNALGEVQNIDNRFAQTNAQLSKDKKELSDKIQEVASTGTTTEVLKTTTQNYIDSKLDDGTIANMTIEDNSITSNKYADASIDVNKLSKNMLEILSIRENTPKKIDLDPSMFPNTVDKDSIFIPNIPLTQRGRVYFNLIPYTTTNNLFLLRKVDGFNFIVEETVSEYTHKQEDLNKAVLIETPFFSDGSGEQYIGCSSMYFRKCPTTDTTWFQVDYNSFPPQNSTVKCDGVKYSNELSLFPTIIGVDYNIREAELDEDVTKQLLKKQSVTVEHFDNDLQKVVTGVNYPLPISSEEYKTVNCTLTQIDGKYQMDFIDSNLFSWVYLKNQEESFIYDITNQYPFDSNIKWVVLSANDEVAYVYGLTDNGIEYGRLTKVRNINTSTTVIRPANPDLPSLENVRFIKFTRGADEIVVTTSVDGLIFDDFDTVPYNLFSGIPQRFGLLSVYGRTSQTTGGLTYIESDNKEIYINGDRVLVGGTKLTEALKNNTVSTTSPLTGLSWNVMGDSISTVGAYTTKHYFNYIAEKYDMDVVSYGISGTKIGGSDANAMCQRYTKMRDNVDIVTVLGGVNDFGQSSPLELGVFSDTTNATFYGSLHIMCQGLLEKYPHSIIMFITPMSQKGFWAHSVDTNKFGLTVFDYGQAIKDVCGYYGIPVCDLGRTVGFTSKNPTQNSYYLKDGLHANERGHEKMAICIENSLKQLF